MHDARHFYAVRAIRAGTPYELVVRQLGHADGAMVAKVYGRFEPDHDERDRWELAADALDRADAARAEAKADGHDRVDGRVKPSVVAENDNAPERERAGSAYEDITSDGACC